jgi:hypothetical protein
MKAKATRNLLVILSGLFGIGAIFGGFVLINALCHRNFVWRLIATG